MEALFSFRDRCNEIVVPTEYFSLSQHPYWCKITGAISKIKILFRLVCSSQLLHTKVAAGKMHIRAFTPCSGFTTQNMRLKRHLCDTYFGENKGVISKLSIILHFLLSLQKFPASHTLLQTSQYVCSLVWNPNEEKRLQKWQKLCQNHYAALKTHPKWWTQVYRKHGHPARSKTQSNTARLTQSQRTSLFKMPLIVRL